MPSLLVRAPPSILEEAARCWSHLLAQVRVPSVSGLRICLDVLSLDAMGQVPRRLDALPTRFRATHMLLRRS